MAHPNQGGSSNRQGPGTKSQGKRGPITGKRSSITGSTTPFTLQKGKPSGAGRNMAGHNWTRPSPNKGKPDGGWYLGRKKS
jgi:hypothetical protein